MDASSSAGTAANEKRRRLAGILLMIVGSASFAAVDGISKILAETQSVAQIVWARYALAIPALLLMTPPAEWRRLLKTTRPGLQAVRGATPLTLSVMMVLGVHYLPLADATVILFAGPFIIVALSAPLLGERVVPASWIGVALGFAAVVIVAKPGFGELSAYALYPALAAVFYAFYQILSRSLGAKGERPNTTLAWTLLVGGVVATPFAIFMWEPLDLRGWLLMAALGTVFGIGQSLLIRAFTNAPAALLAPFGYAQVIAATIFGALVFDAVPDWATFVGIALLIAAGIYVARVGRVPAAPPEEAIGE
ncbi:MAG TPA: DMT family transporter [Bauldia sp.]|nr:DMT family transporter [Bauldia sp.]